MHSHTQASVQPNTNPTKRSSHSVHREHRERAPTIERETIPQPIPVPQPKEIDPDQVRRASVRPSRHDPVTESHRSRANSSHHHHHPENIIIREREHDRDRDRDRDRSRRRHTYDPDHQASPTSPDGAHGSKKWYNNGW